MCIGFQGKIPWHVSSDLRRFKALTMNHHILMGRKTYQSIGRPLPGRVNLVVSGNNEFIAPGCKVFHDIKPAVEFAKAAGEDEFFVIGGETLFRQVMPCGDRIYLTRVAVACECDTWFPIWVESEWILTEDISVPANNRDDYNSLFQVYERI